MRLRFHTADVFTDRVFGGNPLAVFADAEGLPAELMQLIARELNLSETVFVLPADDPGHARRLRIFTPAAELPFAGHPTIGTAYVLAATGAIALTGERTRIVFEEGIGPVEVMIQATGAKPCFAQLAAAVMPRLGDQPPPIEALAGALSLQPSDLLTGSFAPQAVSCGVPFLIVPLRDRDALRRARIDSAGWSAVLADYWAPQVYLFVRGDGSDASDWHARMFAPAMGIAEDPATGAAATALAGYLALRDACSDGTLRWTVTQGVEMGRPSRLELEADKRDGRIVAIRVGGAAVLVGEGTLQVPSPDL